MRIPITAPSIPTDAAMPNQALPTTLAFVAGFVDACTFLAFSGFFVAQATGSFVVAGSELVDSNAGFTVKVLAIPVFILAGMVTTCIVRLSDEKGRPALMPALCVEALLLIGLTITGLMDAAQLTPIPALFGLAAMGVQSAAAHLLLSGYGSTNVMTTNTTQLSIDLTNSILNRRLEPKVAQTGLIMLGFLVGVIVGAVAFKSVGLVCLLLAVAIVLALAIVEVRSFRIGKISA